MGTSAVAVRSVKCDSTGNRPVGRRLPAMTKAMPLPVRSRRYDEEFWKELMGAGAKRSKEQNLKELGFHFVY